MDMTKATQLTVAAVLAGAVALIAGTLVARAETTIADLPKYDDMSAAEKKCHDEYITDDHPTEKEMAAYYHCVESKRSKPIAFRPWQRAWQCSDIRVTETVTQRGIVNYDLAGTIWGGSQFALDIQRGTMWFNGRPCAFLGSTP